MEEFAEDNNSVMRRAFDNMVAQDKMKSAMDQDMQFIEKVAAIVTGIAKTKIHSIISDSLDSKQNPVEALKEEFEDTPMRYMDFYTRSTRTKMLDRVTKPTTTGLWKAFIKVLAASGGHPVSMAFHMHGQRYPWVLTNHVTGYEPVLEDPIQGCILVYVRGDNLPVHIFPLDIYMKAIK
jgi:hypothetical protein